MTDMEEQIETGIGGLAHQATTAAIGVGRDEATVANSTREIAERVGSSVASVLARIRKSGK